MDRGSDLIPSKVIDSVSPTDYDFTSFSEATRFKLQEIAVDGGSTEFGPFDLMPGSIGPNEGAMVPMLWLPLVVGD